MHEGLGGGPCNRPGDTGSEASGNFSIPESLLPGGSHFISHSYLCSCLKQKSPLCLSHSGTYLHIITKLIFCRGWFYQSFRAQTHTDLLAICIPGAPCCVPGGSFYFFNFYCYSVTVVCLFSPSLHPTQLNPPPSPTSTLPLGFVHVSFIVVPVIPSSHCPPPPPTSLPALRCA